MQLNLFNAGRKAIITNPAWWRNCGDTILVKLHQEEPVPDEYGNIWYTYPSIDSENARTMILEKDFEFVEVEHE